MYGPTDEIRHRKMAKPGLHRVEESCATRGRQPRERALGLRVTARTMAAWLRREHDEGGEGSLP